MTPRIVLRAIIPGRALILVGVLAGSLVLSGACRESDTSSTPGDSGAARLDGLVFSVDRGATSNDHGTAGNCSASGCPKDSVCCQSPLPCAGTCLPDCRVSGNTCPPQAPTCDQTSGICQPGSGDGGPKPPLADGGPRPPLGDGGPKPPLGDGGNDCTTAGCPKDNICCQSPLPCAGMCVPDCRVSGNTCPQQAPTCDQTTGVCK